MKQFGMFYILKNGEPVEVDLETYVKGSKDLSTRVIRQTHVQGVMISTVFLNLSHGEADGKPLLFETMIFGGARDSYLERYTTIREARYRHAEICETVRMDLN